MSTGSTPGAVGTNIVTGIQVIREAHASVSSLLTLLDERLAKRGYVPAHPTNGKWVGLLQNGAQLGSTSNWLASALQRGYLGSQEPSSTSVIINVDLAPEKYAEPVLGVLGLSFVAPVTAMEFWKSWAWDAGTSWHGIELDTDVPVPDEALSLLLRKRPARAVGRVVRLCQLDRQNIERRVIETALNCVRLVQELVAPGTVVL